MKIKRKIKEYTATAILTGDLQIRETVPTARIDDYLSAQDKKLKFLRDLQKDNNNCPILDAGDLFDSCRCSHQLVAYAMNNLPDNIITIPGNHDLPSLNIEKYPKSPINVLASAKKLTCIAQDKASIFYESKNGKHLSITGFPWGIKPRNIDKAPYPDVLNIALVHYFVYKDQGIPGVESERAIDLLKKLNDFDLIVTGHNHKPFVVEYQGRLLVNPGAMMRMHADESNHKPRVYLWYANSNTVDPVYFPIEKSDKVLSKDHIDIQKEKDSHLESFITRLNNSYNISLSFTDNLESYFNTNRTKVPIKRIVYESIDMKGK